MERPYRRARNLLAGLFLTCALLTATHLGEFWPYSIYPMFSQGGKPWVRSLIRDVSADPDAGLWRVATAEALPGQPFALAAAGASQNDLSDFLSKSTDWGARRVATMRKVLGPDAYTKDLLVMRVDGRLGEGDAVDVTYTPFLLLTPDSAYFNPNLDYPDQ